MKRREFLKLLGVAIAGSRGASAQTSPKVFHLGTLTPGMPIGEKSPGGAILLRVLAERGYRLGENLTYDARGAMREISVLPQMLQEMKAKRVDVLVILGYPTAVAAKSTDIATVIAYGAGDPVATGLVKSLARPDGTITGISDDATALTTKRLSLLKQLLPNLHRVAMLWNRDDHGMMLRYEASAKAAQVLGVTVQPLGVREPDDFNSVFTAMDDDPPEAILMVSDSLTDSNRKRVYDYALAKRLPAIYESDPLVRDGGLMSYGADPKESFERAGDLAARIFNGARPADLPFEQPVRYPFVINLKTAKAMSLEIPPALGALADEVIE
jgi:putative ABC transport system substrate-binding protein